MIQNISPWANKVSNKPNSAPAKDKITQRQTALNAIKALFVGDKHFEDASGFKRLSGLDVSSEKYDQALENIELHIEIKEEDAQAKRDSGNIPAHKKERMAWLGFDMSPPATDAEINEAKNAVIALKQMGPMTIEETLADIPTPVGNRKSPWAERAENAPSEAITLTR